MKVEVSIHKFDEVDTYKLVSLAFQSRYSAILESHGITSEKYAQVLENYKNPKNENMLVIARNHNTKKIVGWMHIYTGFPAIYFIGAWHPIIDTNQNEALIASKLLAHGIEFTRRSGIHTLEVHFNKMSEERTPLYEVYSDWYQSQNFSRITEEAYMKFNLENFKGITMETQAEFKFVKLSEIDNESLHNPFFETFLNSKDILFLSQTREQQEIAFRYWFDRTEPFCEQSSFAVLKDDKVIGFSAVRPRDKSRA
jgi:hypothetical protein